MSAQPEARPSLPIAGRRLKRLLDMIPEVASITNLDALAAVACRAARDLVGADEAAFVVREGAGCRHLLDAEDPVFCPEAAPLDQSVAGRAILERRAQEVDGRDGGSLPTGLADGRRLGTLLAVPTVRGDAIGAIVVGWRRRRSVSETAHVLLRALADSCVVALENLQLVEQLEQRVEARTAALKRARDAAETASRAKSVFLANMSHELRTPLNAILGFAQILERDPDLAATQSDRVGSIRRSGEHLLALITDLLDMARIEAGRLELVEQDFLLGPLLRDVAGLFEERAQRRGLRFELDERGPLPAAVRGDATRLRQILSNLLGNAVKFTVEGSVTFVVRWLGGRGHFEVRDTGPGIEDHELPAIFEPFTQVGDRHRFSEGTGLGLPITVELVRTMGGSLEVDTEPGRGSTFRFDVPLRRVEASDAAVPDGAGTLALAVTGYAGRRRRILVVDDHPENRAVVTALLEPLGFAIDEAGDGLEALEALDGGAADLVLLDLVMPGMDGFEFLPLLRDRPYGRRLPVVAMSASVSDLHRSRAVEAGADAFLPKPVVLADLLGMVGRHLELAWQEGGRGAVDGAAVASGGPGRPLPSAGAARLAEAARAGDVAEVERLLDVLAQDTDPRDLQHLRSLARDFHLDLLAERAEELGAGA